VPDRVARPRPLSGSVRPTPLETHPQPRPCHLSNTRSSRRRSTQRRAQHRASTTWPASCLRGAYHSPVRCSPCSPRVGIRAGTSGNALSKRPNLPCTNSPSEALVRYQRALGAAILCSATILPLQSVSGQSASRPSSKPTEEEVRLKCPLCVPDITIPFDENGDLPKEKPMCGFKAGWLCCRDKYCAGGMRCVQEKKKGVILPTCRPMPVQPTRTVSTRIEVTGGLFGHKADRVVGGRCPVGTKRESKCQTSIQSGAGNCFPNNGTGWVSESATDCRCNVHVGTSAFGSMTCIVSASVRANAPARPRLRFVIEPRKAERSSEKSAGVAPRRPAEPAC
jgi:hypothetical protein